MCIVPITDEKECLISLLNQFLYLRIFEIGIRNWHISYISGTPK